MTRENQKLIYWMLDDYAKHKFQVNKPNLYHKYESKKDLKKLFVKYKGIDISKLDPFEKLKEFLTQIIESENTTENKVDKIISYIMSQLQIIALQLDGTFSLALHLLSNKAAIDFTTFLFDYFLDNEIPFRKEIANLYAEQQQSKYVYAMLSRKKCAICGKRADLEHFDSVNSVGGYKFDNGLQTRFISLCREHHQEKHNIEVIEFEKKYNLKGIFLKPEQVKYLKDNVYKNHFKNYKESE